MSKKQTIEDYRIIKKNDDLFYIQELRQQYEKKYSGFWSAFLGYHTLEPTTKEWVEVKKIGCDSVGPYRLDLNFETYDEANLYINKLLTADDIEIFEQKQLK
jgi:hypothetical protein